MVHNWGRYRENSCQPLGDVPPGKFGVSFDCTPENGGNKVTDDGTRSRELGVSANTENKVALLCVGYPKRTRLLEILGRTGLNYRGDILPPSA